MGLIPPPLAARRTGARDRAEVRPADVIEEP